VGIADCHNGLGDYSLAEREYRLAEQESVADRQDLNLIRARIGLGILYRKQGWIEDAATLGRTTEDPQLAHAHFRIAADFIRQTVDTLADPNLRNLFLSQPEVQAVLQRVDET